MNDPIQIFRGEVFYFKASPLEREDSYCYYPDGALVISEGKIIETAPYHSIKEKYRDAHLTD